MVYLLTVGLPGETELQRAIELAARSKSTDRLCELLCDPTVSLTIEDRQKLALFIQGGLSNSQGRKSRTRETLLDQYKIEAKPINQAVREYRKRMQERRESGQRIRNAKELTIQQVAKDFKVSPDSLRNKIDG